MIRDERGSAMVEMALVLPMLLILLCGMVELGRIFHSYIVIQQAARDAVRYVSIGESDAKVSSVILQSIPSLDAKRVTYSIQPKDGYRKTGDAVSVEITYAHAMLIPFLKGLLPDPFPLHAKLTMRME
ncbi:TadE/TadG family type IV pilus assembly protein [Brevibacillus migulae]|uniref:TadE/TadG family type IV pilus assembly protein n=1 Tax=Brevibacillus migulae TaxID=1644114 RepID=UPI00106EE707|nr:TadE/TadG family type IV pilus assembly protein [Brevibacillus migulae]